jgi:hypothetical protein
MPSGASALAARGWRMIGWRRDRGAREKLFDRRKFLALTIGAAAVGEPAEAASKRAITLANGARLATAPFQLIDNRIFLEATINGAGPFSMIFDTGGSNIVTPEVARAAGLAFGEKFEMNGAGAGTLPAWPTKVASAASAGFAMRDIGFTILPLDSIRDAIGFARLDGLFGHEVLSRFVVRIDYDAGEMAFAERDATPKSWRAGDALGFDFVGRLPSIAAMWRNEAARFILDTGDRSSLTLFAPFADARSLRDRSRFRGVTGWGVGGPILADLLRTERLVLGGHALSGVTTRLPVADSGVFGTDIAAGSIGTGVLKRFAAVYDYRARKLYLERGAMFDAADPVDLSGMWIVSEQGSAGRAPRVHAVDADGPAERAGVVAGDMILSVNGEDALKKGALALREQFKTAQDGAPVVLSLSRGGSLVEARLALKDRLR